MGVLANSNAIESGGGGYTIDNSLRFTLFSDYLARTPASASSRTTYTLSFWMKRGAIANYYNFFGAGVSSPNYDGIRFNPSNQIEFFQQGATVSFLATTQVFRDVSAWYHFVFSIDTTQATESNRIKMYVNGEQITAFSTATYPSQNYASAVNNTYPHAIGASSVNGTFNTFTDDYMAEVNFIDGQALTPSDFGETNTDTGQWIAQEYTGTYGTNGFYLPFNDGTSTTTLGYDSSGNGNNWTLNNFTRSAGVSDCWMNDVPSGNGSAVGGNYAVLNPLNQFGANGSLNEISNGNLTTSESVANHYAYVPSSIAVRSGKWYAEFTPTALATLDGFFDSLYGICAVNTGNTFPTVNAYYQNDSGTAGTLYKNGSSVQSVSSASTTQVVGIALDLDAGSIQFYLNNVALGSTITGLTEGEYLFFCNARASSPAATTTIHANFGQRSFAYTPPSGFKALCTANLPAATIKQGNQYMDATLYSGNSSTQTVVNAGGFQPDIVWMKARNIFYNNLLHDSSRGVTQLLIPNATDVEATVTDGITSFNSNGFSLGSNGSYNRSSVTYVGWQWRVNGGSTVTNTDGSISSQVMANPTAGVSIVTYTGTGANATVGHGLGVAPSMVIVKCRSTTGFFHVYASAISGMQNGYITLNTTNAFTSGYTGVWQGVQPTSSVFSIGTDSGVNTNTATYVAYGFSEIDGFSKFGLYTGNGSADGPFTYTGFRPRFVMIKLTSGLSDWWIWDTARQTFNQMDAPLYPNTSAAETSNPAFNFDILSNGFKMRSSNATVNGSGQTYIYMAFAENPFANSNAR